jgi:acyl carrier protein
MQRNPINRDIVENKLRAFIEKTGAVKASDIKDDSCLFSSSMLDSFAFLQLVHFLEQEFGLDLNQGAVATMTTLDRFDQIVALVMKAGAVR